MNVIEKTLVKRRYCFKKLFFSCAKFKLQYSLNMRVR